MASWGGWGYPSIWALVQERAEACIALSTEGGFALWVVWGTLLQSWVLVAERQKKEDLADLRRGLTEYQALGAKVGQSVFLAWLAEAYGKVGQYEEAHAALAEALDVVARTGERVWEAEVYLLKGESTLPPNRSTQDTSTDEAEACFLTAIEIAQRQQAKSLELRAATSLARLWQQQGKRAEAHQLLSAICAWFTEGFDTKDLQEAKALLEELH